MLLAAETAENVPSYAVGWGSLALINAGLAQSKNRSGFAWFFVSVFIGPIATFALVTFCEKLPEARAEEKNA